MKRHLIVAGVSALCMALAPTMALGTESPPVPLLGQGNSAPASASATNTNGSDQAIGQAGGGEQKAEQTAVNTQVLPIAAAPAVAAQVLPVNLNLPVRVASPGDNGTVEQSNSAPAKAKAANVNGSEQVIGQSGGGDHPKGKDGGSTQSAKQTAINTQILPIAAAPAASAQVLPINANVPVRIASPGSNGAVDQSNSAPAKAKAANVNGSDQSIRQDGGQGGGSQWAEQTAINTQLVPVALAPAVGAQIVPVNLNLPIRLLSPGEDGTVEQSNSAPAKAKAANVNTSSQVIGQGPGKKGAGAGSQHARQKAINTQFLPIALAPAISPQVLPINANVPVRLLDELPALPVDPFALLADPVGTVGGALPVNPLSLLPLPNGHPKKGAPNNSAPKKAAPMNALSSLPLPLDAVTGLAGGLPLGTVTGLLPALPLDAVTGLAGGLPLGTVTGRLGGLPLVGTVTGLLPPLPVGLF
jgi:hypothetical protein